MTQLLCLFVNTAYNWTVFKIMENDSYDVCRFLIVFFIFSNKTFMPLNVKKEKFSQRYQRHTNAISPVSRIAFEKLVTWTVVASYSVVALLHAVIWWLAFVNICKRIWTTTTIYCYSHIDGNTLKELCRGQCILREWDLLWYAQSNQYMKKYTF